eukprot:TRINITY_DN79253_c0_g1_i1.p1 TRINITY_DN79253_c0_g1~~TRINITY_DN79253_c0_g1_i1.p1  ORF type:complete len:275 (+),score=55.05 TRINITY_DN79253_c0_g1_i1:89-913(+)
MSFGRARRLGNSVSYVGSGLCEPQRTAVMDLNNDIGDFMLRKQNAEQALQIAKRQNAAKEVLKQGAPCGFFMRKPLGGPSANWCAQCGHHKESHIAKPFKAPRSLKHARFAAKGEDLRPAPPQTSAASDAFGGHAQVRSSHWQKELSGAAVPIAYPAAESRQGATGIPAAAVQASSVHHGQRSTSEPMLNFTQQASKFIETSGTWKRATSERVAFQPRLQADMQGAVGSLKVRPIGMSSLQHQCQSHNSSSRLGMGCVPNHASRGTFEKIAARR